MTRLEPEPPLMESQASGAGVSPVVEEILAGKEKIVSHPGESQYKAGGIASCGLAGLNFVRVVLGKVEEGLDGPRLLDDLLSRRTSEASATGYIVINADGGKQEVLSICHLWASNVHLEVDDIFKVMPIFKRSLTLVSSAYGEPSFSRFRSVLSELQSIPTHAAVLITRPPEIITCFKLPIYSPTGKQDVFVIFDSHPRTDYPDGAGFIINTSLDATASRLDDLLAVDSRLLTDNSLQWQTQLLANFSGHFFVAQSGTGNSVQELTEAVMESSLAALRLQAEVSDLKFQNSGLLRDRQSLETELDRWKEKYRSAQRKPESRSSPQNSRHSPSSPRRWTDDTYYTTPSKASTSAAPQPTSMSALEYFSSPANITRRRPSPESTSTQLHTQTDHRPIASTSRSSYAQAVTKKSSPNRSEDYTVAAQMQAEWDRAQHEDARRAKARQREFEEEDARLIAEREALQKEAQVLFDCGICFDKLPEDYVARIPKCNHAFCRECLKGYVVSKLTDKLYPIFCPMCVTENTRVEPGVIGDDLVQILGLNDDQYQVLQELQIATLSILIHCRGCLQSVFVDRAEYEEAKIVACPLPRCNYAWCKNCQQAIVMDGPKHSCDGSSELEHLMKRRGWKHCPGCRTPFQKSDGCNHMTCMSPGCNTHFCYLCGESIVRSGLQREVRSAVSGHYRRCRLFEDVAER